MKQTYQPSGIESALDPITGAFFWRSKEGTLLKVDLEASEYAEQSPFIGASASDSIALPFQLSEAEEERVGIKLAVNNDDDDRSGTADMTQISGDTNVAGDNDSAALRIRFSAIDIITSGTVSIELKKTSGEFGARLWKDRFDKSFPMLVAAATAEVFNHWAQRKTKGSKTTIKHAHNN